MKKSLCILIIFLTFYTCRTKESSAEKMWDVYQSLVILDSYYWVNVCPPKDATLTQGSHTISLNEGEEYWFDVSTTSEPYASSPAYFIGITESSGQTLSVGNPVCNQNGQIFNPSQAKAEGNENNYIFEDGIKKYLFGFGKNMAGIKSTSGSGNIVIIVP